MKLAVLGTGKIVQEFLPMIQQVTDVELVALLSTPRSLYKAKEMQAQYHIQEVYTDYETLLSNATIDTVYVALPNHLHYQYTKAALLQGKNVICEKPFTLNAHQCPTTFLWIKGWENLAFFKSIITRRIL